MTKSKAPRLPLFPRAFLWVTSFLSGWFLICSVPPFWILFFVFLPKMLESPSDIRMSFLGLAGITLLLLIQVAYFLVFLVSSVRLLRRLLRGLRPFRVCLAIADGYLIVCVVLQLVALVVVGTAAEPYLIAIVVGTVAITVVVLLLSRRMFNSLKSHDVGSLLE